MSLLLHFMGKVSIESLLLRYVYFPLFKIIAVLVKSCFYLLFICSYQRALNSFFEAHMDSVFDVEDAEETKDVSGNKRKGLNSSDTADTSGTKKKFKTDKVDW